MNLAVITDELLKKLNNKEILTPKEIEQYLYELLEILEITDYVRNFNIGNSNKLEYGTYNFTKREITINYNILHKEANLIAKNLNENGNLITSLNLLMSIYHETYHAIENSLIDNTDWPLVKIMEQEICYSVKHPITFKKLYPYSIFEREAYATSLESILFIIKNNLHNGNLYKFYKNKLINILLEGYDTVDATLVQYPMKIMESYNIYGKDVQIEGDLSIYDILRIGGKLTDHEFLDFLLHSDIYTAKRLEILSERILSKKVTTGN